MNLFHKIKCWLGFHTLDATLVRHYYDTSYMRPGSKGVASSKVTYVCTHCKFIKVTAYRDSGFLELQHLKKLSSGKQRPTDQPKYW